MFNKFTGRLPKEVETSDENLVIRVIGNRGEISPMDLLYLEDELEEKNGMGGLTRAFAALERLLDIALVEEDDYGAFEKYRLTPKGQTRYETLQKLRE